jgi:thioredoxin 1
MSNLQEVDEKNFDQVVVESKLPVLVDFWAPWCSPCQAIAPIVAELAEEYKDKVNFAKLNVDEAPGIPQRYGIHSIPTLIVFNDGKPMHQVVGMKPKKELKEVLEQALS